jgi:hypothetical protein
MPLKLRRVLTFAPGSLPCEALLVFFAASIAALAAHIAIDLLGDILLVHDTYDDITHESRTMIACTALAVVAGGALRLLFAALDAARTLPRRSHASVTVNPRSLRSFVVCVVAATFVILGAMELIDLTFAGQPFDNVAGLLGGSIWLGIGITLPVALCAAFAVARVAHWVTIVQVLAIGLVAALFVSRTRRTFAARCGLRRTLRFLRHAPALTRSTPRRGPPAALTIAA